SPRRPPALRHVPPPLAALEDRLRGPARPQAVHQRPPARAHLAPPGGFREEALDRGGELVLLDLGAEPEVLHGAVARELAHAPLLPRVLGGNPWSGRAAFRVRPWGSLPPKLSSTSRGFSRTSLTRPRNCSRRIA